MSKKSQWSIVNIQWNFHVFMKYVVLLFAFHVSQVNASAQSVSASLDRDKILLGEQVTLQLNISNVSEASIYVENWPQVNDTINHTEIIKRSDIDTVSVNGINTYQQSLVITSFDSGRWQLGPFNFILQNKTDGKKLQLQTKPVYLTVLPVDVAAMKDYHPLKDIIDVQTSFNWLPVIIAICVLVLVIIIFIIIKKIKKRSSLPQKIELKGTPLERAMEKLNALEKESLASTTAIKKFYFEMDVITREYLEEVTSIKALHLTAAELLPRLKIFISDAEFRQKFSNIFNVNASVKFAKYMPSEAESRNTLKQVVNILQQIDDNIKRAKADAERMVSKY